MTQSLQLILIDDKLLGSIAESIICTSITYALTEREALGLIDRAVESFRGDKR